jgi:hypothetical protein
MSDTGFHAIGIKDPEMEIMLIGEKSNNEERFSLVLRGLDGSDTPLTYLDMAKYVDTPSIDSAIKEAKLWAKKFGCKVNRYARTAHTVYTTDLIFADVTDVNVKMAYEGPKVVDVTNAMRKFRTFRCLDQNDFEIVKDMMFSLRKMHDDGFVFNKTSIGDVIHVITLTADMKTLRDVHASNDLVVAINTFHDQYIDIVKSHNTIGIMK